MGEIENVIIKANTKAFAPSKDAQKHLTKKRRLFGLNCQNIRSNVENVCLSNVSGTCSQLL